MQREYIIRMMHFQWLCSPAISTNQFKRKLHTVQTNVRFQNIVGRLDYDGKHRCSKIDVPCWRSCLGSWMPWCKTFKARLIPCTHEFTSHVEIVTIIVSLMGCNSLDKYNGL